MKRLIALILAAALALSLAACGSSTPTKDEMLENAQEVDFKEYAIQYAENSATLKEQYGGQTCTISGYVTNIRGDINEVQLEWHDGTAYYTEEEQARLTDNIKTSNNSIDKEISALLHNMSENGKRFILDTIQRYLYYHGEER